MASPLPAELPAAREAFRADLEELWGPQTALERHEVDNIVEALVRQRLLDRLEEKALLASTEEEASGLIEGAGGDESAREEQKPRKPLPSLDSLVRYRRRLTRELIEAGGRLRGLIDARRRLEAARAAAEEEEALFEAVGADGDDGLLAATFRAGGAESSTTRARDAFGGAPAPGMNRAQRRRMAAKKRAAA